MYKYSALRHYYFARNHTYLNWYAAGLFNNNYDALKYMLFSIVAILLKISGRVYLAPRNGKGKRKTWVKGVTELSPDLTTRRTNQITRMLAQVLKELIYWFDCLIKLTGTYASTQKTSVRTKTIVVAVLAVSLAACSPSPESTNSPASPASPDSQGTNSPASPASSSSPQQTDLSANISIPESIM